MEHYMITKTVCCGECFLVHWINSVTRLFRVGSSGENLDYLLSHHLTPSFF